METLSEAVTAGAPKKRLTFTYEYQGRRITKKVENWNGTAYFEHYTMHFIYDGWNLIAEVLATGARIRTYAWGSDLSGGTTAGGVGGLLIINQYPEEKTYSVGYDGNGNITGLYDLGNNGTIAAQYEYGPFGEALRTSGVMGKINPIKFSTKYTDRETELVYYGFRYYDANTGRWISRDPAEETGGVNLYNFCLNRSIDEIDVLGTNTLGRITLKDMRASEVYFEIFHRVRSLSLSFSSSGPSATNDSYLKLKEGDSIDPCAYEILVTWSVPEIKYDIEVGLAGVMHTTSKADFMYQAYLEDKDPVVFLRGGNAYPGWSRRSSWGKQNAFGQLLAGDSWDFRKKPLVSGDFVYLVFHLSNFKADGGLPFPAVESKVISFSVK